MIRIRTIRPAAFIHCRQFSTTSNSLRSSVSPISIERNGTLYPEGNSRASAPGTNATKGLSEPKFGDPEASYGSKSFAELLRAYLIFQACSFNTLVNHQHKLLRFTRKVVGQRLFQRLMRVTIYGQFLGGDSRREILKEADKLLQHKVIPMFAYTAKEIHGTDEQDITTDEMQLQWKINLEAILDGIEIAGLAGKDISDIHMKKSSKVTFLAPINALRDATSMIDKNGNIIALSREKNTSKTLNECLASIAQNLHNNPVVKDLPVPTIPWRHDTLDHYMTNLAMNIAMVKDSDLKNILKEQGVQNDTVLGKAEEAEVFKLWDWMSLIGQKATDEGVCFLVDAEQSYLQSVIDVMAIDLKRVYNKKRPVIHQTYQCYRWRTLDMLKRDLRMAESENFMLGAKVVRGAYIEEERKLAKAGGYRDPINPTYDATTQMYYRVADHILEQICTKPLGSIQATFATHNLDTVKYISQRIQEMGIDPHPNILGFAQLHGMRDHIAFPLGAAGYPAHKLAHYGPVEDAVTYISRRLMENRAGVATANEERQLLWKEMKRRMRRH